MTRYYVDTCIWRDFYEGRKGFDQEDLGAHACAFFMKAIKEKHCILISPLVVEELRIAHSSNELQHLFDFLFSVGILQQVDITDKMAHEARKIAGQGYPRKDVLHAIIARENKAILITNDAHFGSIPVQVTTKKPEES